MASSARNFAGYIVRVSRLSLLFSLLATFALGQQAPFIPVTGPNAPKSVTALFQDSHGALWLGGDGGAGEGLTYFDGSRFISPVKNFPKVLVNGLTEDSEGAFWIAAIPGVYRLVRGRLDRITDTATAGIARIAPDVFLTASASQGRDEYIDLARITKAHGTWVSETILPSIITSIPSVPSSNFASMPTVDSQHVLYPCQNAFCELDNADIVAWHTGATLPVKRHPLSIPLTGSVSRDRAGCVWMLSGSTSMVQCPGDVRPKPLTLGAGGHGQQRILELPDGSVAVPRMGSIAIGRPGKFRLLTRGNGYPSVTIPLLAHDGSIWLGNVDGLFVFLTHSQTEFWTEHDGFDGNTWSILRIGAKVFAAAGTRALILDDNRSRWRPLVSLNFAQHLMAGPGNTLLVSSISDGVLQLNSQGKILRKSEPTNASTLTQTPDGQIWLPGSSGFTQLRFSGQKLDLAPAKVPNPRSDGEDMEVDSRGGLWSCSGAGLIHKLATGWRVLSKNDGLLEDNCRSFAFDQSGDIWYDYFSTNGFSLIRDPTAAKPVIQHFRVAGTAGTNSIIFDRRGWLWRGTEDGLYVADLEQARQGQWLHLDRRDGLPSTDSNTRSLFTDSDGSIWFGAGATVTHFTPPDDLVHPRFSPSVFISGFSWNNGPFQMANLVDDIEHGADVSAHIGSLQFDRRNALRLRYRLLPEQTSWTAERSLDIPLGKLSWGTHTLEVQAQLYTGPWSATVSKSFTVLKPFWLTWPALLAFAALTSSAAAGALASHKKRLRRAATGLPGLADWRLTVLTPEMGGLEGAILDGRFAVSRILARGGFATVFEGRDLLAQQPCAIKIFRYELTEKSWMARRFQQEVSALQQIHHPNVVSIYGHGDAPNGAPYLAMELIAGETLRELLSETRLDHARVASYLRQTGRALAAIHARQICHRDLKPENLMIRDHPLPDGADLVLIDFSIAIVQDPDETLHGISRAAGTLQYMAPEQAVGYADSSSDIYSLAKILLEMLTAQRLSDLLPNASLDLPTQIRELLTQTPHGLSPSSIDLIAQALEFDPARRPRNAANFTSRIAQDLHSPVRRSETEL